MDDSSPQARLELAQPLHGPVATVRILPVGGCEQVAPRWIEVCAREYTFRLAYAPEADPNRPGRGPALALSAYMAQQLIGAELTENLIAIYLDGRGGLLGFCRIARGSFNIVRSTVPDVAFPALHLGAKAAVLAHNHPTGDPTPSRADWQHAEAMAMGLDMVGIELIGAVVVAVGGWQTAWESPHRKAPYGDCDPLLDDEAVPDDLAPEGNTTTTTNPCSNSVE